jgi:hypothetical protein
MAVLLAYLLGAEQSEAALERNRFCSEYSKKRLREAERVQSQGAALLRLFRWNSETASLLALRQYSARQLDPPQIHKLGILAGFRDNFSDFNAPRRPSPRRGDCAVTTPARQADG